MKIFSLLTSVSPRFSPEFLPETPLEVGMDERSSQVVLSRIIAGFTWSFILNEASDPAGLMMEFSEAAGL